MMVTIPHLDTLKEQDAGEKVSCGALPGDSEKQDQERKHEDYSCHYTVHVKV